MCNNSPDVVADIQSIVTSFLNMEAHRKEINRVIDSELIQELYLFYNNASITLTEALVSISSRIVSTTITPFLIFDIHMVETFAQELYNYMVFLNSPDCLYNQEPLHIAIHKFAYCVALVCEIPKKFEARITTLYRIPYSKIHNTVDL